MDANAKTVLPNLPEVLSLIRWYVVSAESKWADGQNVHVRAHAASSCVVMDACLGVIHPATHAPPCQSQLKQDSSAFKQLVREAYLDSKEAWKKQANVNTAMRSIQFVCPTILVLNHSVHYITN